MDKLLIAEGVMKRYRTGDKSLEILRGVDMEVDRQESVAIVGTSGAGKSTLLHILATMDMPTAGKVFFEGRSLVALGESEKNLIRNQSFGFIFQFHHLLPDFSALENVMIPAIIHARYGRPQAREQAGLLLDRVGLGSRLQHRPRQLSGGERQRVAIARALINRPKLLFCDEPTGNLDVGYREELLALLMGISIDFGTSSVIVTHDMVVARQADRILHLQDGILSPIRPESNRAEGESRV